ncbi:UFD4 Ubiquitin fusion degradation protein 4 [Candida maltosa Xu316]
MVKSEKNENNRPHSDDDDMSIQDIEDEHDSSDNEESSLIRLSQQTQHRRATQTQYTSASDGESFDVEVISNDPDLEDSIDDEILEEEDEDDDDDEDHSGDEFDRSHDEETELDMLETADFLRQLIQARRNRTADVDLSSGDNHDLDEDSDDHHHHHHREDDDDMHDDDDDDDDHDHDDDDDDDEDDVAGFGDDDEDPRAEFLRVIGALTGNRSGGDGPNGSGGNELVDVMQRLMGGAVGGGGGGIFLDGGSARDGGEINSLINNLSLRQDTYIILESLNELSERLLMMNGLTADRVIPANKLARALVELMEDPALEEELELHLVACRCLYNFLEVNQDFIHDALNNNAIPALCNKLLEIKYIDLTEQALQTLEMISRDPISHNSIISNNGLTACLQYLDFLTIHAQRKCLTIVSNSCTNISVSNFPKIKEAFNSIAEVVRNHNDKIVVENAWLTISRIIMCFKNKPDLLNEIFCDKELLFKELTKVIWVSCNKSSNTGSESSQITLNYGSCLSLIKSLIVLASVSIDVSRILISECEIGSIIVKSLNKYVKQDQEVDSTTESISIEALMSAPKDLISQFLSLIGYLLPIAYSPEDALYLKPNFEEDDERKSINDSRIELCRDIIPNDYWKFVNDIWSLLILSFQATMDVEIRRKSFINLYRIITSNTNNEDFSIVKDVDTIASLLANVVNHYQSIVNKDFADSSNDDAVMLSSDEDNDNDEDDTTHNERSRLQDVLSKKPASEDVNKLNGLMLLFSALKIIKVLLEKTPFLFLGLFEKEGLINDVLSMLHRLKDKVDVDMVDPRASINSMMASYSNKYVDSEFSKEYEFRLSSSIIYANIVKVTSSIDSLYIESKTDGSQNVSENMRVLQEIKSILQDSKKIRLLDYDQWLSLWRKLNTVVASISSFELISSGIIESLTKTLGSEFGSTNHDCVKAFTNVFFTDDSGKMFVHKLQEALTRSESFDIVSANSSTNQSSFIREQNQAAIMANQIKLKLTPDGDSNEQTRLPGNMQNMVLSVHAIATFKSVFAFLKQRFKFIEDITGSLRNHIHASDDDDDDNESHSEEEDEEENEDGDDNHSGEHHRGKSDLNIEFLINGEVIPNETTIYGAIYRSLQQKPDEIIDPSRIWSTVHNITFRKVSSEVSKETPFTNYNLIHNERELNIYDVTTIGILKLLKNLYRMNTKGVIPIKDFTNWKLTVKLNRQLEEPLVVASGTLPGWSIHLTKQFPFIFPLETRIFFLQSTSFGYSRLIHQWQLRTNQGLEENGNANNNPRMGQRLQLGRPTRQKVRISRKMMLQSAVKVLGMYGSTPGILEIEYFDEVGSGLGPTLEFYSTVSKEFSKKKLKLWRDEDPGMINEDSYVINKQGLFPVPMDKAQISSENGRKVLYFFSSLGKFIARALLDSRIIDFNFNTVFLLLIQLLNKNNGATSKSIHQKLLKKVATLQNLRLVDPGLADSLEHLNKYLTLFKDAEDINKVTVDGATVHDLALFFEVPGNADYELIPNGSETQVTPDNLELYINKVIEASLFSGIINQTKAFMDGFSKVFPINSLIIFSPPELVELFGNSEEDWSHDTLAAGIIANHGYTKDSPAIKSLINILINFSKDEKRDFLQFLTGASKLPIGGFKALRPELTVVRKHAEDGLNDDDYLPSVMTCANYLKLPNYSSENVMKERLLKAIRDGAGAFLLS